MAPPLVCRSLGGRGEFDPCLALSKLIAIQVAMRAVPRRREFYARLAEGGSTAKLEGVLTQWLDALEVLVTHLRGFLEGGGYGRVV